jgi:hypothetical protein
MQITSRTSRYYWGTVALGVGIGIVYLIGFLAGGKPLLGVAALGIMVAFSAGLAVVATTARPCAACSTTGTSVSQPSTCGPRR